MSVKLLTKSWKNAMKKIKKSKWLYYQRVKNLKENKNFLDLGLYNFDNIGWNWGSDNSDWIDDCPIFIRIFGLNVLGLEYNKNKLFGVYFMGFWLHLV